MLNDIEKVLITEEELNKRVKELAKILDNDYEGKNPVMVCILKGSIHFFSTLTKEMKIRLVYDFMAVSSYGANTFSSGNVKLIKDLSINIEGRHVVLVEDIVDSGHTLNYLIEMLKVRKPASIEVCTLLDKKCRRVVPLKAKYVGFDIDDYFVLGYGLDYDEYYRNLPFIGILKEEVYKK